MTSVCLYFKVHQPYRLKRYRMQGVNLSHCYADVEADREIISILADKCYLQANEIIYDLIREYKGKFRISYSISGTALELFQKHRPDVISSFKKLVETGCVEILAETYYHSLSSLHSKKEFQRQISKHSLLVKELFGVEPAVFRNTELIHNNYLAKQVADLGFKGFSVKEWEEYCRAGVLTRFMRHLITAILDYCFVMHACRMTSLFVLMM